MITALGPEPSYCKLHLGALTPSQWTTCWKYGWDEPTTTLATRLGHDVGHDVLPVLIVLAVLAFVVLRSMIRT